MAVPQRRLVDVTIVDPLRSADPLGEALHYLRVIGNFYCRSELTEPWGLTMPTWPDCLCFHIVTAGQCLLEADGAEPRVLRPGDLVLVPHGRGHTLRSGPGTIAPDVIGLEHEFRNRYAILRHGGGGAATTLVCGLVRLDHPAAHHIVPLLPDLIHVEPTGGLHDEWMQSTLRLIAAEAAQLRPGGEAVITRLSDILVIQALRDWIEHAPAAQRGWLGALRDRQIGRAITLIHRDPARDWTVASLAGRGAVHRTGGRASHAVPHPVADADGADVVDRGRDHRRGRGIPPRIPLRSRVQPSLQAHGRHLTGNPDGTSGDTSRVKPYRPHRQRRIQHSPYPCDDRFGVTLQFQLGAYSME
jgi:Cupin